MRCIFLFVICFSLATASRAQSGYASVKLEHKTDFKKAEEQVLHASHLLLSTKFDKDDLDRLYAIQFLMKWMEGTPDYSLNLEGKYAKPFADDPDILGLYMAALVQLAVESKGAPKDAASLQLHAAKRVLQYAAVPANNLKLQGELKKMSAAHKKNELEKYFAAIK
ncbi:hypothetical protein V9K67_13550 [Paraflavisolibacter sp. H34]|uniref:hypothetical protein n=1 Tax=Huijunlia imazamoxiresistens TaxID=3127457 RepID=UPI00301945EC